jgi:protocatechuate 3,4-dioxygenase beta subunit
MFCSKRRFLKNAGAFAGSGIAGLLLPMAVRAKGDLPTSPAMDLGPFYPVEKPIDVDADLTRLDGHKGRARGQVIELSGRVLARDGKPAANAKVEIWQANAVGRYSHHGDRHVELPLDPDFQGYAVQTTDSEGRFRFLTVKPGAYPAGSFQRSPHIHFDVQGKWDRLVTQMYFPNEPLLAQDRVLLHDMEGETSPLPDRIFGKFTAGASKAEPGAALYTFDVVLANG